MQFLASREEFIELVEEDEIVEDESERKNFPDLGNSQMDNAVDDVPPPATVPLNERTKIEFLVILFGSIALSFNAGFVNGCTYQLRNIPVSHVTGTTTKAGLYVGNNDGENFSIMFCLICSFIFGSAITGCLVPNRSFHLGFQYGPIFIIGSFLFLLSCLTLYYWPDTYYYFYFACMASGLQNSMTTKYSGNIIRTTHMTGTATDIGLLLGRLIMGDTKESWKLLILGPIFLSFFAGAIVSVHVFRHLGQLSLMINVIVFFSIGLAYSVVVGNQMHIPIWKAFFGFYQSTGDKIKHTGAKVKRVARKLNTKIVMELKSIQTKNPLHSSGKKKSPPDIAAAEDVEEPI